MQILQSKLVLPVSSAPVRNGAVAISGSKIVGVGGRNRIVKEFPSATVTDLGDMVILPGLINTHTHLELSYLRNAMAETRDFFAWIRELIDNRTRHGRKGLKKAASAALGEAIRTGTTCVGDITGTGDVVGSLRRSGVRARIYHEIIGLDPDAADSSIEGLQARLDEFGRLPSRLENGVSPHSSYSVSQSIYNRLLDIISDNGLCLSVHLSETMDENVHIKGGKSGMDAYMEHTGWAKHRPNRSHSPVGLIGGFGLLDGALVAHAVHVNKRDMNLLKKHNASVAHCPRSNHLLNVGRAPVRDMLDAGVNVALGTDSLLSNLDLDMWEEMRFAYLVNDISAEECVRMATVNGAKALGLGDKVGAIERGMEADLIALRNGAVRADAPPYPAIVRFTRGEDVALGMVAGRVIYSDGTTGL